MPHYNISNATTNMRMSDEHGRLLRTHFNNISMLCDIIRDSQSILEHQQRNMNNNHRRNNYIGSNIFNSAFDSSSDRPSDMYNNVNETNTSNIRMPANSIYNTSNTNLNADATSLLYVTLESLFPTNASSTRPNRDVSLNIIEVDASNISLLSDENDAEDCHIYDVKEFRFIENPVNDICPITRDRFYQNQNVYMTKNCRHIFNKTALNMWLERNNTCPYCRANIFENT